MDDNSCNGGFVYFKSCITGWTLLQSIFLAYPSTNIEGRAIRFYSSLQFPLELWGNHYYPLRNLYFRKNGNDKSSF